MSPGPSIPFAEGWNDNGHYLGRPVDVQQYWDGSLLVSDDLVGARLSHLVRRQVRTHLALTGGQLPRRGSCPFCFDLAWRTYAVLSSAVGDSVGAWRRLGHCLRSPCRGGDAKAGRQKAEIGLRRLPWRRWARENTRGAKSGRPDRELPDRADQCVQIRRAEERNDVGRGAGSFAGRYRKSGGVLFGDRDFGAKRPVSSSDASPAGQKNSAAWRKGNGSASLSAASKWARDNRPKVKDAARFETGGVRYHISADR